LRRGLSQSRRRHLNRWLLPKIPIPIVEKRVLKNLLLKSTLQGTIFLQHILKKTS
jgi:hypothetical protein